MQFFKISVARIHIVKTYRALGSKESIRMSPSSHKKTANPENVSIDRGDSEKSIFLVMSSDLVFQEFVNNHLKLFRNFSKIIWKNCYDEFKTFPLSTCKMSQDSPIRSLRLQHP